MTAGTKNFSVVYTDTASSCSATRSYVVVVSACNVSIGGTISNGSVGTPINTTFTGVDSLWVVSGSIPGITFSGLTATGFYTQSGSFLITLGGKNEYGCLTNRSITVTVSCPSASISPTTISGSEFVAGNSTTISITQTGLPNGGNWSKTGGPSNLTIDPTTGEISWVNMTAGTKNFTVVYTDTASGCSATRSYVVVVSACNVSIGGTLSSGVVNGSVNTTLSGVDSLWLESGSLPDGISLNGLIYSGFYQKAGNYYFTLGGKDEYGCATNK